jgi:ATP-dependent DNA helicase RecQ
LQESGRAGRDGKQSRAILLWGPEDEKTLVRNNTDRFSQLLKYARDTSKCRRHSLLEMLNYDSDGEVPESNCCDICCQEKSGKDLREEASVTDFFRRNKRRFTIDQAASVLAASETIRWSEEEASKVIIYLLKTGKIKKLKFPPWKNKITAI